VGPMMALLAEALEPNLAQTTDGTPAMVHCGPFANIAHGTSSVVSQRIGMHLADYVVNETGFASDLGFEKYMDLVMPSSGIKPAVAVLVTTVQSLRNQGEGDLELGVSNLEKHIGIVHGFGLPVVVAINRFPQDTDADLQRMREFCEARGASFALSEAFTKGGEGAADLARTIVAVIEANPDPQLTTTYEAADSIEEKITKVARRIYGAAEIEFTETARKNLARFEQWGFGHLPICIAKTQYSLSDDPKRMGAPSGWTLHLTDVSLSAGAGFLVVTSGAMMLMPGLPKASRAMNIDVDDAGEIIGMS
jgi:formate--tetrahydrofolate ligase